MTVAEDATTVWFLWAIRGAFLTIAIVISLALIDISESLRKLTRHIPESVTTKEKK